MANIAASHKPITLLAVGDVCPGDHCCPGFGVRSLADRHGADFAFQRVADILRRGDVVFANLEGSVSDVGADPADLDTMEFRGRPAFAAAMTRAGFTIVNVANNHAGEHGDGPLTDSVTQLRQAGLAVIGLRGAGATSDLYVQTIKDVRVGWLSYTWQVSHNVQQDRALLAVPTTDAYEPEIRAARREVDVLIVSAHWGREFINVPPRSVIEAAHRMTNAGADLVLGHHPHVLQGIERCGRAVIAYSLGDFVFDLPHRWLRRSAVLSCRIENAAVADVQPLPIWINRSSQPEPAGSRTAVRIFEEIERSTAAIQEFEKLEACRNDVAARMEAAAKRRFRRQQFMHLIASVHRMEVRTIRQKFRRRRAANRRQR